MAVRLLSCGARNELLPEKCSDIRKNMGGERYAREAKPWDFSL